MQYFAGIDIGSLATKVAIIDSNGDALGNGLVYTGAYIPRAADRALQIAMEWAGIAGTDVTATVTTGYGRKRIQADAQVTEIRCHARGVHHFFPRTRTILDIGGQDTKAIHLDALGEVDNFAMNDKCAAGTGRFLEVMARALEVEIDDMGGISLTSEHPVKISSTCTVFSESEVISHVANGEERADIIRGIHESIAQRAIGLMRRIGIEAEISFSGGVARNVGVRQAIEQGLGVKVNVSDLSQFFGALGAALIARDNALKASHSH